MGTIEKLAMVACEPYWMPQVHIHVYLIRAKNSIIQHDAAEQSIAKDNMTWYNVM